MEHLPFVRHCGGTKIKKTSRGLHAVWETDREKGIVGDNRSGSRELEKRISSSSGKGLSWILKNKKYLFLQREEVVPKGGMACAKTMELW